MTTVYVIMCNDFPECVFAEKEKAEAFIAEKKAVDGARRADYLRQGFLRAGMYWRLYEFEAQQ